MSVLGRLSAEKNHAFLLKVLAEIVDAPFTLNIVGTGPEERPLKALSDHLNLRDKVIFMGYRSDIPLILSKTDIHVMPTLSEGFGLVAVEAMAAGVPSVVSDLPVLHSILGEDGFSAFFAPFDDKTIFAAQLRRLIEDPCLRRAMGQRARKAAQKHDVARMHHAYADLYQALGAY
jgi:glycosyltransferase involved in cell wall biosynthesis